MCDRFREVISGMDALISVVFVNFRVFLVIKNLELLFPSLKKSFNYVKS